MLPTIPLPSLTPHENIYTIPNLLTFSRLAVAPFIGYAIVHDAHAWAMGLFVYAGVSDLLDGWIARRWKLQTVVGSVVDPMADKILMTVLTVSLAAQGSLPGMLSISGVSSIHSSLSPTPLFSLSLCSLSVSQFPPRKLTQTSRRAPKSLAGRDHPGP